VSKGVGEYVGVLVGRVVEVEESELVGEEVMTQVPLVVNVGRGVGVGVQVRVNVHVWVLVGMSVGL